MPLGEFEQIVLLAILRLGENAYGVSIRAEIAACTDREPTPGALYTTLDRLEEKGFVRSRLGDPTPIRGGRSKRYFEVTQAGVEAVAAAQRNFRRLMILCRYRAIASGRTAAHDLPPYRSSWLFLWVSVWATTLVIFLVLQRVLQPEDGRLSTFAPALYTATAVCAITGAIVLLYRAIALRR